jgi:hypothetical protein
MQESGEKLKLICHSAYGHRTINVNEYTSKNKTIVPQI